MRVKLIWSYVLVVVSILFINGVFTFVIHDPFKRLFASAPAGLLVGVLEQRVLLFCV